MLRMPKSPQPLLRQSPACDPHLHLDVKAVCLEYSVAPLVARYSERSVVTGQVTLVMVMVRPSAIECKRTTESQCLGVN